MPSLTLGLLSLDLTSLDVLVQSGDPNEKYYATLIKPIRKQGHWLLVTLLLANVIVNETLPILTDTLWGGGWPAVMISTTLIVIFGEIIPQAICSRYGLAIGANFRWVVQFLMILFSPIAYPISKLLDYSLGKTKGYTYKRAELKALVALHEKSEAHFGPLNTDEVTIIKAVLELRDKNVRTIMTPLEDTYMLSTEQLLDETKIQEIVDKGYSRIPVYRGHERKHILGMLLVKKLASYDPHLQWKVKEFCHAIAPLPIVSPQSACFETLDLFQTGRSHMAIVANGDVPFGSTCELDKEKTQMDVLGIVTLEDILEEMIGEEIIDETDIYVDVTLKLPVPRLKSVRFSNPGLTTNLTVPMHYPKLIQRSSEFSVHSLSEDQDKKPLLSS
ncbi:hypothetical protein HMI54_013324 [Coelomomyces lativittatus]|nr:hypothetical protein HMI54_013324 [Coelomomyces lativittatus]